MHEIGTEIEKVKQNHGDTCTALDQTLYGNDCPL